MPYTIKQFAELVQLSVHTLRYYDQEGLMPFVNRDKAGNRVFVERDLEWFSLISCLKNTGMPIKKIGVFIQGCIAGDTTLDTRRQMLVEHRQAVLAQISELEHNLKAIDQKIEYYNRLCSPAEEPHSDT